MMKLNAGVSGRYKLVTRKVHDLDNAVGELEFDNLITDSQHYTMFGVQRLYRLQNVFATAVFVFTETVILVLWCF